jgi:hypothetical protein
MTRATAPLDNRPDQRVVRRVDVEPQRAPVVRVVTVARKLERLVPHRVIVAVQHARAADDRVAPADDDVRVDLELALVVGKPMRAAHVDEPLNRAQAGTRAPGGGALGGG